MDNKKFKSIPVGSKGIMVQLLPLKDRLEKTDSGILVGSFVNTETDGGRPDVELNGRKFTRVAQVMQISDKCKEDLQKEMIPLSVGDFVMVSDYGANQRNWVIDDPMKQTQDHSGVLTIGVPDIKYKLEEIKD